MGLLGERLAFFVIARKPEADVAISDQHPAMTLIDNDEAGRTTAG